MAPRLRCATRERRLRGRPAPGRAPPRPVGLNSRLVCRGRRRRRTCRGRRLPVFRGRLFPCTRRHRGVLHSGNRLFRTTVYANSIVGELPTSRPLPLKQNIALFIQIHWGDCPAANGPSSVATARRMPFEKGDVRVPRATASSDRTTQVRRRRRDGSLLRAFCVPNNDDDAEGVVHPLSIAPVLRNLTRWAKGGQPRNGVEKGDVRIRLVSAHLPFE